MIRLQIDIWYTAQEEDHVSNKRDICDLAENAFLSLSIETLR